MYNNSKQSIFQPYTTENAISLHKSYAYPPNMLIAQSEELLGLRTSHDRRLERMQALELNYKLLLKQLKTYETER